MTTASPQIVDRPAAPAAMLLTSCEPCAHPQSHARTVERRWATLSLHANFDVHACHNAIIPT